MTYQQNPAQPGQQPPPPGMYAPPPKKMSAGAKVGIGCGGAVGVIVVLAVIGAAIGGGGAASDAGKPDKVAAAPKQERQAKEDAKPAKEKPKAPASQADRFKAFVKKSGTAAEKSAIRHVTKVQGADEQNDILDSADVYTDFTGGLMGPHQSEGKLIASAFADWKDSKNGLVTIYDAKGEILSNGNF
ncbi:hypothetical protein [Streptomyces lydicus]|uniref:hypothetical protein n=1 Tax=Streptomyces lydicus TaxID=47763 RepID=UPI000ACA76E7|nr:hypothetical protein [Streptomyces lydicus]MDC7335518.1 hypothetical protein [Streptomyces lydicus]UEG95270.1 hypothetical protein LJ741_34790 [Streptomyces lydicus]